MAAGTPTAAEETLRAGPYSIAIRAEGSLGELHGPEGQVLPADGGRAEICFGGNAEPLGRPAAIKRSGDAVCVEYVVRHEPKVYVGVENRLRTEGQAVVLTRQVAIHADRPLRENLTVSLPQWPARMPADTWLPLYNGTGGRLGAKAGGYILQGPLPPDRQPLAIPMATYRLQALDRRVTVATDPYYSTLLTPDRIEWTYPKPVGLEDAIEKRSLVTVVHPGTPDDALAVFFQFALPEVPPGPPWLHEIAMVGYDYMSDGGRGWFKDIDALAVALPRPQRGKVFLCLHGWYDWCGRYSFDAKSGKLDSRWTAFGNAVRYKNQHGSMNLDGQQVDTGFEKCSAVAMTPESLHERLDYARSRGFRVGLYFADGMNAGTALPGYSKRLVLRTGGWAGPDTSGESYCMNPSAPEVRDFFLRYTDALLGRFGDSADALVWDETFMVPADCYGSAEVPGYASRAMMRLLREVSRKAEAHQPPVAFLASDCAGAAGTANYALVAHGTYQDTWCQPDAWSYGIFPNWRNTVWSCCWWPVHKWKWVEFGVRNYQAPVAISNGWGDHAGFSAMTPEMRKSVLDLFHWRAQFQTRLKWMEQLPAVK
jgi:hypothetical protein